MNDLQSSTAAPIDHYRDGELHALQATIGPAVDLHQEFAQLETQWTDSGLSLRYLDINFHLNESFHAFHFIQSLLPTIFRDLDRLTDEIKVLKLPVRLLRSSLHPSELPA